MLDKIGDPSSANTNAAAAAAAFATTGEKKSAFETASSKAKGEGGTKSKDSGSTTSSAGGTGSAAGETGSSNGKSGSVAGPGDATAEDTTVKGDGKKDAKTTAETGEEIARQKSDGKEGAAAVESAPVKEGIGGRKAIRQALRKSGVKVSDLSDEQRQVLRKYGDVIDTVNQKDVVSVDDAVTKLKGKTGDTITAEPIIKTADGRSLNGYASPDGAIGISKKLDRIGPQRVREVAIQELGERAFQEINALGKENGTTAKAADGIFSKGDFGAKVANGYFGVHTSETAKTDTVTLADGRKVESAPISRRDAITALQGSARDLSIVQAEVSDISSAQTNLDTLNGAFATRITNFNSDVRDFVDAVNRQDGVLNPTEKSKLKQIATDYSKALKTTATSYIAVTTGAAKAVGKIGDTLAATEENASKGGRVAFGLSVLSTITAVAWGGLALPWVAAANSGSFRTAFSGSGGNAQRATTAVGIAASAVFFANGAINAVNDAKQLNSSTTIPQFSSTDSEIENGEGAMAGLKKLLDKNGMSSTWNTFKDPTQKFFDINKAVTTENFLMAMLLDLTNDRGSGPPYNKVNEYRNAMVDLGFTVEGSSRIPIAGQKSVDTDSAELGFSNEERDIKVGNTTYALGTPGFILHRYVPTEYGKNIKYFDDYLLSPNQYVDALWR